MAEGVRFELTKPFGSPVFKTGAINHSATLPLYPKYHHSGKAFDFRPKLGHRPRAQGTSGVAEIPGFSALAYGKETVARPVSQWFRWGHLHL